MCNAWNHSPGCRCGWGGEGHLGGGGGFWNHNYGVPAHCREPEIHECGKNSFRWSLYREDFSQPTTCPICGQNVFFIRHNGGSVWLDCLGYPWDKHGCFDAPPISTKMYRSLSPHDIRYQKHINTTLPVTEKLQSLRATHEHILGVIIESELYKDKFMHLNINTQTNRTLNWYISNSLNARDFVGSLILIEINTETAYIWLDGSVHKHCREHPELTISVSVTPEDDFKVGDKVRHPTIGTGTITLVEKLDDDYKLHVKFGLWYENPKRFMAKISKIEKVVDCLDFVPSIIHYTKEYMHNNYPIKSTYKFIHNQEKNDHNNGLLEFNEYLTDITLTIWSNRTPQIQAKFFMHEYYHITQLERHGFNEHIKNRFKYEIEAETFCRLEFQKVLDLYNSEFGTNLECSITEPH